MVFWSSYKKIGEAKKKFLSRNIRLGRGLIFHICPSNVPTNFIYSFFFGLLSGNSNIVKVSSKVFPEKNIILSIINKLFKKKKYLGLKNSNFFIQNDEKIENTYIKWRHTNKYWVDQETGFVMQSFQVIAPNLPPFFIQITKKPSQKEGFIK